LTSMDCTIRVGNVWLKIGSIHLLGQKLRSAAKRNQRHFTPRLWLRLWRRRKSTHLAFLACLDF
jgi:hypothetical protein